MRYIDIDSLQLPDRWLEKAEHAAEAVRNGANPDDHGNVWRSLKDALAVMLYEKCWYCEVHIGRSDNAVDHFRPKNRVADTNPPHEGYRWLAFAHTNFRYACTYCNSMRIDTANGIRGGKADSFPLAVGSPRIYREEEGDPCELERPILLDPCDIEDWRLLGVKEENGRPCPASNDAESRIRAKKSIAIYHLDLERTCNERHRIIVDFLQNVRFAKALFPKTRDNAEIKNMFKEKCRQIIRAIGKNAPFSGEMIFLLRGHRSDDHPWINELLEI